MKAMEQPEHEQELQEGEPAAVVDGLTPDSESGPSEPAVHIPWWSKPDQIFYNTDYEEEPTARELLTNADIIVILFGVLQKRSTRLAAKYLARFQEKVNSRGGKVQLIFSPMDEIEKECQLFVNKLEGPWPWLVIPWTDEETRSISRTQCKVKEMSHSPAVVALRNEGEGIIVSNNAKIDIIELAEAAYMKWKGVQSQSTRHSAHSGAPPPGSASGPPKVGGGSEGP